MTEDEEQTQYFETARGLFELATGASELDRVALERCSTRYFWKACGMPQAARGLQPGAHAGLHGGGERPARKDSARSTFDPDT